MKLISYKCNSCGEIYKIHNKSLNQKCPACGVKANMGTVVDNIKKEKKRYCIIYGANDNILRKI